jgi:pyridinium-3,5-biscarboxylic acid mononucleotide synthase
MAASVDEHALVKLLDDVAAGRLAVDRALARVRDLPYEDLDHSRIDHHRELRTGATEAVFAPGKTPQQVCDAAVALDGQATGAVFVTRANAEQAAAVLERIPAAEFDQRSGLVVVRRAGRSKGSIGSLCVLAAGTSDLPCADEAAQTADALGLDVVRVTDVGVAGLHRVLEHRSLLETSDCVVVVAGMEGALPSMIAGLTSSPLVAVPTSVGYGASFEGLAALLGMLSSCAPGVAVVNIDNGFGAAQVAHRIIRAGMRSRAGATPVDAAGTATRR